MYDPFVLMHTALNFTQVTRSRNCSGNIKLDSCVVIYGPAGSSEGTTLGRRVLSVTQCANDLEQYLLTRCQLEERAKGNVKAD